MINKISKLEKIRKLSSPVLSVYLSNPNKKSPSNRALIMQFHSLIDNNISKLQQKILKQDIQKIETYLRDVFDTHGNRSVIFFSAGKSLWEVIPLEFCMPSQLIISDRPYFEPLKKAFKKYVPYLVVLVDRKRAKFFTVYLGRLEEKKEFVSEEVPQRVHAVHEFLGREDKVSRHIEDHLHKHLALVANEVVEFTKNKKFNMILIGGHKEIMPKFIKHLPGDYRKKILTQFVSELNIPINDIFLRSKKLVEKLYKK